MTIPERKVLQYGVFLPFALPLVLTPLYSSTDSSVTSSVVVTLSLSLLFGGIPYAILVVTLLWWGRRKPITRIVRAAWLTPLLFAPLATLFVGAFGAYAANRGERLEWAALFGAFAFAYALVVGYGYVVIVLAARSLLGWAGILQREGAASEIGSRRTTG
jgi:hypothetical protein